MIELYEQKSFDGEIDGQKARIETATTTDSAMIRLTIGEKMWPPITVPIEFLEQLKKSRTPVELFGRLVLGDEDFQSQQKRLQTLWLKVLKNMGYEQ